MPRTPAPPARVGMLRHLAPAQWAGIAPAFDTRRLCAAGEVISRRGEALHHSLLLEEGIVGRRIAAGRVPNARHHLVALQVPGDFVDLHAYPLKVLDHDIVAITAVRMAVIAHERLQGILAGDLELTRQLWSLTLVDAAIHRHWALRNGTMRALQRVANLLAELVTRLDAGRGPRPHYTLDLTQTHIGDACGLSSVHVSRVLRDLREADCCTYANGRLVVSDRAALFKIAGFDPYYLYLPQTNVP